jgi:hypothetical protein
MYAGGGDAQMGRQDCLTDVSTCPVTERLRLRFGAFLDSAQTHNPGGGSTDPVCRGCQSPYSDARVADVTLTSNGAIVIVTLDFGSPIPLAVIEVFQNGELLVDDIQCVRSSTAEPTTSLYLISGLPVCMS